MQIAHFDSEALMSRVQDEAEPEKIFTERLPALRIESEQGLSVLV